MVVRVRLSETTKIKTDYDRDNRGLMIADGDIGPGHWVLWVEAFRFMPDKSLKQLDKLIEALREVRAGLQKDLDKTEKREREARADYALREKEQREAAGNGSSPKGLRLRK